MRTEEVTEARFICKQCGAESPVGIGYVAHGEGPFPAAAPGCPNYHERIQP